MSIENRFDGIQIASNSTNTEIVIRARHFPFTQKPVAIITCPRCEEKDKTNLFYVSKKFRLENKKLICPSCNQSETISYERVG